MESDTSKTAPSFDIRPAFLPAPLSIKRGEGTSRTLTIIMDFGAEIDVMQWMRLCAVVAPALEKEAKRLELIG